MEGGTRRYEDVAPRCERATTKMTSLIRGGVKLHNRPIYTYDGDGELGVIEPSNHVLTGRLGALRLKFDVG